MAECRLSCRDGLSSGTPWPNAVRAIQACECPKGRKHGEPMAVVRYETVGGRALSPEETRSFKAVYCRRAGEPLPAPPDLAFVLKDAQGGLYF